MATRLLPEAKCTRAAPASRASWCGQLRCGELYVPVKAYAAIATPPANPLRQLHVSCGQRIEYRKWCPQHGAVPPEGIVKGYPYRTDEYIEFSESELAQLVPADDKTIYLRHFVHPSSIDPVLFAGRSLYLAPANPAARHSYDVVRQAIDRSGKWGIGVAVLANRRQLMIIRPTEDALLMHTLHHPSQCRALGAEVTSAAEVRAAELRPLLRMIKAANGDVKWDDYLDDCERRLTELVENKVTTARRSHVSTAKRKRRTASGRALSKAKSPAAKATSGRKRKVA